MTFLLDDHLLIMSSRTRFEFSHLGATKLVQDLGRFWTHAAQKYSSSKCKPDAAAAGKHVASTLSVCSRVAPNKSEPLRVESSSCHQVT